MTSVINSIKITGENYSMVLKALDGNEENYYITPNNKNERVQLNVIICIMLVICYMFYVMIIAFSCNSKFIS